MRLVVEFDVPAVEKDQYVREWLDKQDAAQIVRDHIDAWGVRGFELDATEWVPGRRVAFNVAAAMEQDALKEAAQARAEELIASDRGLKDTDTVGPGDIRDDKGNVVGRDEYSEQRRLSEQNKDVNDLDDPDYKRRVEAQDRHENVVGTSSVDFLDESADEQKHEDQQRNLQDQKADEKTARTTAKSTDKSEDKVQADNKK